MEKPRRLGIGLGVFLVLLVGAGWFAFPGGGESADRAGAGDDENESSDARAALGSAVSGCPLRVDLPGDFEVREPESDSPAFRAVSKRRRIDVKIDCRRADDEVDVESFLADTYRGVRRRYGESLSQRHAIDADGVRGWWVSRVTSGRFRFFNVVVRGGTIVTAHVGAPEVAASQTFNAELFDAYVQWE